MTTVAYKDGIMASDSLITDGSARVGHVRKIGYVNGWLYGFAGGLASCQMIEQWIKEGADPEHRPNRRMSKGTQLLMVHESAPKSILMFDDGEATRFETNQISIGTGSEYAVGAMLHGAGAKEAVKLAAKVDTKTGGKIISRSFKKGVDA